MKDLLNFRLPNVDAHEATTERTHDTTIQGGVRRASQVTYNVQSQHSTLFPKSDVRDYGQQGSHHAGNDDRLFYVLLQVLHLRDRPVRKLCLKLLLN
jgi:hypothetical protein